jgi:hypothetical protein
MGEGWQRSLASGGREEREASKRSGPTFSHSQLCTVNDGPHKQPKTFNTCFIHKKLFTLDYKWLTFYKWHIVVSITRP